MDHWNDIAPEVRARIELGEASAGRLQRGEHVDWWVNTGRAILDLQNEAMRGAGGINTNKGRRYNEAWAALIRHVPKINAIDTGTRAHAAWLAQNWEMVKAWLDGRGDKKRLELHHPRAIHRAYDAAMAVKHPAAAAEAAAPTRTAMRQDDALELIRALRAGVFPPGTSMEQVADALDVGLSYNALRLLHRAIGARLANAERQDRIEADVRQRAGARVRARRAASESAPEGGQGGP
jgi:hypothetical protein